jgi:hypothetical protein
MMRGINKQNVFEEDNDRYFFLEVLKKVKEINCFDLYCYCLMNNHKSGKKS